MRPEKPNSMPDHTDQKLENTKLGLERADSCFEQSNNWLNKVNFQPEKADMRIVMIRFKTCEVEIWA